MAKQYLLEVIPTRMPEEGAAPPPAPEPKPDAPAEEGKSAEEKPAEGESAEETKAESPPEPEIPEPVELDRSKGSVGTIETGEVVKITDPAAELGPGETFLPNAKVAALWKKYILGELEPPAPK